MLSIKHLSIFYFNSLPQALAGFPPGLRAGGSACRDGCGLVGTWQVPAPALCRGHISCPSDSLFALGGDRDAGTPLGAVGCTPAAGGLQCCMVPSTAGSRPAQGWEEEQGVREGDFGVPFPPSPGLQRPWVSHVTSARFIFHSCKTRTMIPFPPRRGVGRLN